MGFENLWENFYPTISDSHILILVTYKSLKRSCMNTLDLRLPESWVCELLTNRHHHSGKCSHRVFPPDCNPHIPTSYLRVIEGDVTLACWSTNLYPTSDLLPPPTQMCGSSITLRKTLLIPNTIIASLRLGPKN